MNDQTMRFRLGIFVLSALILLAVLITLFGRFPALFKQFDHYTIVFSEAAGVATGTPVRRSGVRIGEVEKVELDNETGKVTVRFKVDGQYTLRKGDTPTVVRSLLGGDASIDFLPPRAAAQPPDTTPVEPGSVLVGVTQADTGEFLQQANQLMQPAQETLKEMQKVLTRIDRMTPLMEETLREYRDVARATREVIPTLRATAEEVRDLAKASRETIPALRATAEDVRELAKASRETVPTLRATAEEFRELAKASRETIPTLRATAEDVGELAKSSRAMIPELRRTNDEIQLTARYWGKLGERLDVMLQTNEDKLVKAVDQLNDALKGISNIFSEENQRNLAESLRNVRNGSTQLESISRNADELVKESRVTIKRVNDSVIKADQVLTNMQQATRPLVERSASISKNLDESADRLNRTLIEVQEMLRTYSRADGTFQRLLTDPSLYNRLDEAACSITRVMPRLDHILRDVEVFADKIARHPEALGIGGVVRPGSGLKDAPTSPTWQQRAPGH